jgi:hypothetical protein
LAISGKIDRKALETFDVSVNETNVLNGGNKSRIIQGDGHAVICIGRENIDASTLRIPLIKTRKKLKSESSSDLYLYDYDMIEKKYIFMDDNFPPYKKWALKNPSLPDGWNNFKPSSFIVPLYKRVHLEAKKVKELVMQLLVNSKFSLNSERNEIVVRTFLTSSRTLKDNLLRNNDLDIHVKQQIFNTPLPRFVWVTELSSLDLIEKERANGFIILDATEADTAYYKPLIFLYIWGIFYNFATRLQKSKSSINKASQISSDKTEDFGSEIEGFTAPADFEVFKGNFTYVNNVS